MHELSRKVIINECSCKKMFWKYCVILSWFTMSISAILARASLIWRLSESDKQHGNPNFFALETNLHLDHELESLASRHEKSLYRSFRFFSFLSWKWRIEVFIQSSERLTESYNRLRGRNLTIPYFQIFSVFLSHSGASFSLSLFSETQEITVARFA